MADIKVELEEYMKKNNVQDFLNNIVLKIVEHKPANPLFYLHIQKSHFKISHILTLSHLVLFQKKRMKKFVYFLNVIMT